MQANNITEYDIKEKLIHDIMQLTEEQVAYVLERMQAEIVKE